MSRVWNKPGIPHTDWEAITAYDLGFGARGKCQMCDHNPIRYVHVVRHADYGDLHVGYVCAGRMTGQLELLKTREAEIRREGRRKDEARRAAAKNAARIAAINANERRLYLRACREEIAVTCYPDLLPHLQEMVDADAERAHRIEIGEEVEPTEEDQLKAGRKANWLQSPWRTSAKGNPYLNIGGHNICVFPNRRREGTWKYKINDDFSRAAYPSEDAAKLALFDEFDGRPLKKDPTMAEVEAGEPSEEQIQKAREDHWIDQSGWWEDDYGDERLNLDGQVLVAACDGRYYLDGKWRGAGEDGLDYINEAKLALLEAWDKRNRQLI